MRPSRPASGGCARRARWSSCWRWRLISGCTATSCWTRCGPTGDPASAVNNLHQALHVARRVLAGDGPSNGLLELRDDVVVLQADGLGRGRRAAVRAVGGTPGPAATWPTCGRPSRRTPATCCPRTGSRTGPWAERGPAAELCDLLVDLADGRRRTATRRRRSTRLQRALAIDPLHERRGPGPDAAARGGRAGGPRRWRGTSGCATTCAPTYGTDPDPETRRLYRELLTEDTEVDRRDGPNAPPQPAAR